VSTLYGRERGGGPFSEGYSSPAHIACAQVRYNKAIASGKLAQMMTESARGEGCVILPCHRDVSG